jgi:hypothetical protein
MPREGSPCWKNQTSQAARGRRAIRVRSDQDRKKVGRFRNVSRLAMTSVPAKTKKK